MEAYIAQLKNDPNIKAKDWAKLEDKLNKIVEGGRSSVHIISDFDMTLTKYWHNGERSPSTHGLLNRYSRLGKEFKQRSDALYQKYYPMEVSNTIPYEDKVKAMVQWWNDAHDIVLQFKLTKEDLTKMVQEVCYFSFFSLHLGIHCANVWP